MNEEQAKKIAEKLFQLSRNGQYINVFNPLGVDEEGELQGPLISLHIDANDLPAFLESLRSGTELLILHHTNQAQKPPVKHYNVLETTVSCISCDWEGPIEESWDTSCPVWYLRCPNCERTNSLVIIG